MTVANIFFAWRTRFGKPRKGRQLAACQKRMCSRFAADSETGAISPLPELQRLIAKLRDRRPRVQRIGPVQYPGPT
jgi:hypothetical protein